MSDTAVEVDGLRKAFGAVLGIGLAVVFGFQLVAGIELIDTPESVGDVRTLAILVVVCALGGIARSWELIGGPQIGLRREVVHRRRAKTLAPGLHLTHISGREDTGAHTP